jgi:hypothetical protein
MSTFDSSIPVRADKELGPSDFKTIRRSRSVENDSLSDSVWAVRWRSSGLDLKGRGVHLRPRVPARVAGEACRDQAPVRLQRVLDDGKATTTFSSTRGT